MNEQTANRIAAMTTAELLATARILAAQERISALGLINAEMAIIDGRIHCGDFRVRGDAAYITATAEDVENEILGLRIMVGNAA